MFPPQCGAPPPQAAATTPQAPLPQQATDQLQQGIHYFGVEDLETLSSCELKIHTYNRT